jgi:NFU1 iron-sulfur cluster scaffold homolog, mitochondrial
MPYTVKSFQATPNPNALKCLLDRTVSTRPRSYFGPDQVQDDPLATALFGLGGITNLLINDDWITVSKAANADWKTIKSGVERVLREAP